MSSNYIEGGPLNDGYESAILKRYVSIKELLYLSHTELFELHFEVKNLISCLEAQIERAYAECGSPDKRWLYRIHSKKRMASNWLNALVAAKRTEKIDSKKSQKRTAHAIHQEDLKRQSYLRRRQFHRLLRETYGDEAVDRIVNEANLLGDAEFEQEQIVGAPAE